MIGYKTDQDIKDSKHFKWLSEVVEDYTGLKLTYRSGSIDHENGYIDHQSINCLDKVWSNVDAVFKSNMKDIIFNKNFQIIIDNDNINWRK